MRSLPLTLQTKVGRRVLALFVLSALVPVIALAALGYVQVKRQLVSQTQVQLEQAAKSAGMGILDQLRSATIVLTEIAARGGAMPTARADSAAARRVHEVFQALETSRDTGEAAITLGDAGAVWLAVPMPDGRARLRGALRPEYLWQGARDRAVIGEDSGLCVRDARRRELYCPGSGGSADTRLSTSWEMFLRHGYGTASWEVEASQPTSAALAPVLAFRRVFLATVVIVLGLVVVLSTMQVRRTLQPLQELQEGTRRLARREFSRPVRVTSGDEFEDLARSFNSMGGDLERQFASNAELIVRLEQLSYGALAALASAVDASSPWTAGHSERVTALSLRMAEHLRIEGATLDALRRGGLLHDIGKIGISPDILDKPGILDPDELARVRLHPVLGAKILAPLEAFAEAVPVVLHHHERFDGTGYPDRLAGENIPRLARLLAVADVYDALVSSRPYRPGWDREAALASIRTASGSHFDPVMVDAFFAVMDTEGDAARFTPVMEARA